MPHPPLIPPASLRPLRGEAGFTIIEVLVAALIIALVAAGSAVAFVGAIGSSETQRNRSAAEALAQQNQARLTGDTVSQLANLDQDVAPSASLTGCPSTASVKLDGTCYTIHEAATFVSDSTGTPSCSNPSADYLQTSSSVSWSGMSSALPPVTVTGLITPTAGEISSTAGTLAVQILDSNQNPIAGMPVSISGPASASGVTASDGCVLFSDIPTGSYTVSVTPSSGTYVDATTDQVVNASSPDTTTASVSAGSTASTVTQFQLGTPGTAVFSFTDLFPSGVSPTTAPVATSPSVILSDQGFANPGYVACSAQDTTGCPSVGDADTSWSASAWTGTGGQITAEPLYPYQYATYPGICASDNPTGFGGTDGSTTVTAGGTTTTSFKLSSMVVRLYSGSGAISVLGLLTLPGSAGSEMTMPSGSELVITDTGCGVHYVGGPGVSVPSGASALPVSSSPVITGGTNDTGLLTYPGMPDGNYTVCYQYNGKEAQASSVTNSGNGEIIDIYSSSLTTGTCQT